MRVYRRPKTSGALVLERMDQRVGELSAGFREHLASLGATEFFSGPAWYFHRKALDRRRGHASIDALLQDDGYFDAVYATLAAWGLHRTTQKARLLDLDVIRESVRECADAIDALLPLNIATLGEERHGDVVDAVWAVLSRLRVSAAKASLVANSKLLHHVLPGLVPPIDRQYTFRFFYDRTGLSIEEEGGFREMFSRMLLIGLRNRAVIEAVVGTGWNTSTSKAIDNAIVGYVRARLTQRIPQV